MLEPGDTLVLFTDGVTEATSPAGDLFGVERLREVLRGAERAELADVKRRVLSALGAHAAGAALTDDTTILMLRRSGAEVSRSGQPSFDARPEPGPTRTRSDLLSAASRAGA